MLRIRDTVYISADDTAYWTLRLERRLKDESVRELRSSWRRIRVAAAAFPIRVELTDVDFVDRAGTVLLAEMYRDGVEIVAHDCLAAIIRDDIVDRDRRAGSLPSVQTMFRGAT